ncbi:MAG: hypothetical protein ACYTEY_18235 [Planctomycetota bacterium]|jgi:hypothetical protein
MFQSGPWPIRWNAPDAKVHARTPPAPPIRQLTYVSDLQFVPEPEPAEPVWSPD